MLSEQPKQLVCGVVTSESCCFNVPTDHQLEQCVDLDWCTENHELPSAEQQHKPKSVQSFRELET